MVTAVNVVPGKVALNGIRDISIPNYQPVAPSTPISLPVIHQVTPKGELGTQFIPTSQYTQRFGNVFDDSTLYYNPNSVLIKQLTLGGQSRIGVRRLTANQVVSRIPLSAYVQQRDIDDFERDPTGNFKIDPVTGQRIKKGTVKGIFITIKVDDAAKGKEPGALTVREIAGATADDPSTHVYPLFELPAGIGDAYNANGIQFGSRQGGLNQQNIAAFVRATGVYPYSLRMFETTPAGVRAYASTITQGDVATLTLFDATYNNTKYSLKRGVQQFTDRKTSDLVDSVPTPFTAPIVYQDNIDTIAQLLYSVEKPLNTNLVDTGIFSYRQMNPFTCTDHTGVPYYGIATDEIVTWDLTYAVMSQFGISPFLTEEGKLPDFVTPTVLNDPFGLLADVVVPTTPKQAWQINDQLTLADLTSYVVSAEMQNVMVNRQSMWWDVGYSMAVKTKATELLGARKDIFVHFCATVFEPGVPNQIEDIYSRLSLITSNARLFPESDVWGTAALRFSVNKIEAIPNSEDNDWPMSGNLDLAQKWAQAGGAENGVFRVSMSPDHGDYRILDTMHSPNITFEEDLIGATGLELGGITLRPYDTGVYFRPALPTGYATSIDSPLKDQVPAVICIAIEKIAQSKWGLVCGDSTITSDNYASIVKDAIEIDVRDNLGGYVKVNVTTSYNETQVGGLATLNVIAYCYFNKAKYMMQFDLFADNINNFPTA